MYQPFLTAKWLDLVMLNWEVEPSLLKQYLPQGVEFDFFQDRTYISIVAFHFKDTRLLGAPIPFHRNFEELNLRFYVKRIVGDEVRRGVVFVKELVPRACISLVARLVYNENYFTTKMTHAVSQGNTHTKASYKWVHRSQWNSIEAIYYGEPRDLISGSKEEFIAEHYWGYTTQRDGGTIEYKVEHPPWKMWEPESVCLDLDVEGLYGKDCAEILSQPPSFSLVADGSDVTVYKGQRM